MNRYPYFYCRAKLMLYILNGTSDSSRVDRERSCKTHSAYLAREYPDFAEAEIVRFRTWTYHLLKSRDST